MAGPWPLDTTTDARWPRLVLTVTVASGATPDAPSAGLEVTAAARAARTDVVGTGVVAVVLVGGVEADEAVRGGAGEPEGNTAMPMAARAAATTPAVSTSFHGPRERRWRGPRPDRRLNAERPGRKSTAYQQSTPTLWSASGRLG
jgi:hypothetical protein